MNSPSSKYLYGRTSTFGTPLAMTKAEEEALIERLHPGDGRRPSKRGRLPLMDHAERRRLIETPFSATLHLHSSAWGGVFIKDAIPVDGRRVWVERPEDEEWCRMKWEEK